MHRTRVRTRATPASTSGLVLRRSLVALLSMGAAGCGPAPPAVEATTIPDLVLTATESTLFNTRRAIRLELTNVGENTLVVDWLQLDSGLFEEVEPTQRTVEIPPKATRLVPLPYGASICDAPVGSGAGMVMVGMGGGRLEFPLADRPVGLLVRRNERECAVAQVRERVALAFGEDWRRLSPRSAAGDLVITLLGGEAGARVESIEGNIVFNVETPPGTPLVTVTPARPTATVPVTLSADRCDVHALIESKRTYVYVATVTVGDGQPVPVDVEPSGEARQVAEDLVEACLE